MRLSRLLAFAAWTSIALLSVAAFAAFSPPQPQTPVYDLGNSGWAAGRQAAYDFSSQLEPTTQPPSPTTLVQAASTSSLASTTAPTTAAPQTTKPSAPAAEVPAAAEPAPQPAPPPVPSGPMSSDEVRALVAQFFLPEDVDRATAVAFCESHNNPRAKNPRTGAAGLFQHLPRYWEQRSEGAGWGGADIYDPTSNTAVAAWLVYSYGGWRHWSPSQACWASTPIAPPTTLPSEPQPPEPIEPTPTQPQPDPSVVTTLPPVEPPPAEPTSTTAPPTTTP